MIAFNSIAGLGKRARIPRIDRQAKLVDIDDRVVDAAEGDVGPDGAPARRADLPVQRFDESRDIVEADRQATSGHAAGATR